MLETVEQNPSLSVMMLSAIEKSIQEAGDLMLEILLSKQEGLDFFRYMPKEEMASFSRNILTSKLSGEPMKLVSATCPDYMPRTYKLRGGVGLFAERTLGGVSKIKEIFDKYNTPFVVEMHLADGDVADANSLQATGESKVSFLEKISSSISLITSRIRELGMENYVGVMSMSELFGGIESYAVAHLKQKENLARLYAQSSRKVVSAVRNLSLERTQLGDFDDIAEPELQLNLVLAELAGYSTYGEKIGGSSLIVSPGAKSVVPAYNFGLQGSSVSPVVYVQNSRLRGQSSIFSD